MRALALALSLALGPGCDATHLNGTALHITTQGGVIGMDQLSYQARDEGGAIAFGPALRPEVAAGRLPSAGAVRVLLPGTLAAQLLEVQVVGLLEGRSVAGGRALVRVEPGAETAVTITLTEPAGGCDALSCPSGCCATGTCRPGTLTSECGTAGASCRTCGSGTTCQARACAPACSPATCPGGCCESGVCVPASASTCGAGGQACVSCSPLAADTCANGRCGCGEEGPCAGGQRCLGGICRCDADSCQGCCTAAGQCQLGGSKSTCGTAGEQCTSCAHRCVGGACE